MFSKKKIPLYLSLFRLLVVPFFFFFVGDGKERWDFSGEILAGIFILASFTDWLDGKLARYFKVETAVGAYLDTVADKVLVLSALAILVELNRVSAFLFTLFLARDLVIGGVRSMAATQGLVIAAKSFGKWKATLQMIAIPCLFIFDTFSFFAFKTLIFLNLYKVGLFILWGSVILSMISAVEYIWIYLSHGKSLKKNKNLKRN